MTDFAGLQGACKNPRTGGSQFRSRNALLDALTLRLSKEYASLHKPTEEKLEWDFVQYLVNLNDVDLVR